MPRRPHGKSTLLRDKHLLLWSSSSLPTPPIATVSPCLPAPGTIRSSHQPEFVICWGGGGLLTLLQGFLVILLAFQPHHIVSLWHPGEMEEGKRDREGRSRFYPRRNSVVLWIAMLVWYCVPATRSWSPMLATPQCSCQGLFRLMS